MYFIFNLGYPHLQLAALISDTFNLAVSGQVSQVMTFNLGLYLDDEGDELISINDNPFIIQS